MPARHSRAQRLPREAQPRGPRTLRERVPAGVLEDVERRQAAAREEPHPTAEPAPDPLPERPSRAEQPASPIGLETEQRGQRLVRPVEARHLETAAGLP